MIGLTAAVRNTCPASNTAYPEYGNGKGPSVTGHALCPTCGKVVKYKADRKGMKTIIPTHKRARQIGDATRGA